MLNCKIRCNKEGKDFKLGEAFEVIDGRIQFSEDNCSAGTYESIEEINRNFIAQFEFYEEPKTVCTCTEEEEREFIESLKRENNLSYWNSICLLNQRQESKGKAKYGESLEENTTLSTIQRIEHLQEELIDGLKYAEHLKQTATDTMSANDYQRMAMRTAGTYKSDYDMLRNAAYGLNGESGEVIDILKKHEFQGHELDKDKLIDELGDVQWYISLAATSLGVTLEEIMQHNVDKLIKRYPDGFDKSRSINRVENNSPDDVTDTDVGEIKNCKNCKYYGKWIDINNYGIKERRCSNCGKKDNPKTAIKGHYCWNCGAKMEVQPCQPQKA